MTNTDKIFMSNESDPKIQGVMIKNQTVVLEPKLQQQLNQKGYGEIDKSKLLLKSFESLYLLFTDRLTIFKGKKNVDFDSYLQICKKQDKDILTKFLVYRDLRNRGYTVKIEKPVLYPVSQGCLWQKLSSGLPRAPIL